MCSVIAGTSLLINVYAFGFMRADERDDRGLQRFFCYMNLLTGSMLVMVTVVVLIMMMVLRVILTDAPDMMVMTVLR